MDAYDPSNFVLFSKAYARGHSIAEDYGLPDDGRIVNGNRVYQLAGYRGQNALYLLKETDGTLTFAPATFDAISILGLATEGEAELEIVLTFNDGSITRAEGKYHDWFDGTGAVVQGMGRVKREDGSPYYEGGENPRMYAIHVDVSPGKMLKAVTITNVSTGYNNASNRAVIFGISGYKKNEAVEPASLLPRKKVVVRKKDPEPKRVVVKKKPEVVTEPVVVEQKKPVEAPPVVEEPKPTEPVVVEKKTETPTTLPVVEKIAAPPPPIEVGAVAVLKKVLFKQSTAELLDDSYPELDSVADFLKTNPSIRVEVAGHTDAYGSAKANLKLSNERAAEIKNYLVKRGVTSDRVTSKGYGGSKPIAPNTTEESRRLNRRVEFVILSK
jgi:outer membrane protein OmpA-like peptidoglycan-associated protein